MAQQKFVEYKGEEYIWDEDLKQYLCTHQNAYIERACCSSVGSGGDIECGCGGVDSVVCDNPDCTGIENNEIDKLFAQVGGYDEYPDED